MIKICVCCQNTSPFIASSCHFSWETKSLNNCLLKIVWPENVLTNEHRLEKDSFCSRRAILI